MTMGREKTNTSRLMRQINGITETTNTTIIGMTLNYLTEATIQKYIHSQLKTITFFKSSRCITSHCIDFENFNLNWLFYFFFSRPALHCNVLVFLSFLFFSRRSVSFNWIAVFSTTRRSTVIWMISCDNSSYSFAVCDKRQTSRKGNQLCRWCRYMILAH